MMFLKTTYVNRWFFNYKKLNNIIELSTMFTINSQITDGERFNLSLLNANERLMYKELIA
jgi:hypothetical protein